MQRSMLSNFALSFVLLIFTPIVAEGTTVTGTLVDPTGQPLINSTVTVEFSPAPGTTGSPTIPSVSFVTDSNGGFTTTLTANNTINPSRSTYSFTICPNATVQCSIVKLITITGTTQDISAILNAGIQSLNVAAQTLLPKAYKDTEVPTTDLINIGAIYWNTIDKTLHLWDGTVWGGIPSLAGSNNFTGKVTFNGTPPVGSRYQGLVSFGDSITCGFLATTGYPTYLSQDIGGTLTNWCRNGDMAADGARQWVYPKTNPLYTRQPVYTYALGINDSTSYAGNTDKQQITTTATYASLTWLGIPARNKIFGQSASVTKTGTWINDDTLQVGLGTQSTTSGDNLTTTITTAGGPIYIGYRIFDGGTGSATLSIDGTTVTTLNAYGFNHALISTTNGTTDTVALYRFPTISGTHTVSLTLASAGTFSLQWIGTPSSLLTYASPNVYVGSVTRQLGDSNEPLNGQYNTLILNIVNTLISDGLNLHWVDSRSYLNTSTDLVDTKHPNDTGQQHIRDAFAYVIQPVNQTIPLQVNALGSADTSQYSNVNALNIFNQTLLNPGILVYRGNGREMGMDMGSEDWPNPSVRIFVPDNGKIKFCSHVGGTSPTGHGSFTCGPNWIPSTNTFNLTGPMNSSSSITLGQSLVLGPGNIQLTAIASPATIKAAVTGVQLGDSTAPFVGIQIGASGTARSNITSLATTAVAVSLPNTGGTIAIAPNTVLGNHAVCWTGTGKIGYCSTQPDASGVCTCN